MIKKPGKIKLANLPTPFLKINFNNKNFFIKRDDFSGSELSGNKVRKLEFLFKDALDKKSNIVFSCGGDQSNHCRATAIAAASLGIKTHLFLWGKEKKNPDGNLFLDLLAGAKIHYLNRKEYDNVNSIMAERKKRLESKDKKVYIIPEGGSSPIGIWGYIDFIDEIKSQIDINTIKNIWVACGSGGTAAGLLLGCAIHKLNIKINAVNVLYKKEVMSERIINLINDFKNEFNYDGNINFDNLNIVDGFSKEGYKNISKDKVKLIKNFAGTTGIILDPAYTGKAFAAFNDIVLNRDVNSEEHLFVHTGGLFGIFGKRKKFL